MLSATLHDDPFICLVNAGKVSRNVEIWYVVRNPAIRRTLPSTHLADKYMFDIQFISKLIRTGAMLHAFHYSPLVRRGPTDQFHLQR